MHNINAYSRINTKIARWLLATLINIIFYPVFFHFLDDWFCDNRSCLINTFPLAALGLSAGAFIMLVITSLYILPCSDRRGVVFIFLIGLFSVLPTIPAHATYLYDSEKYNKNFPSLWAEEEAVRAKQKQKEATIEWRAHRAAMMSESELRHSLMEAFGLDSEEIAGKKPCRAHARPRALVDENGDSQRPGHESRFGPNVLGDMLQGHRHDGEPLR